MAMTRIPFLCDEGEELRWEFFQTKRAYALPLVASFVVPLLMSVYWGQAAHQGAESPYAIIFLPFFWLVLGVPMLLIWGLPLWNHRRAWRAAITNRVISVRPLGKPLARRDLPLDEIGTIHHHRTFLGEPFGYGTITLYPKEGSKAQELTLRGITRSRTATLLLAAVAKSGAAPPPLSHGKAPALEDGEEVKQRLPRMAWGYAEPIIFSSIFFVLWFVSAFYTNITHEEVATRSTILIMGLFFAPYLACVTLPWLIGVFLFRRRFRVVLTHRRLLVSDHGLYNAIGLQRITAATMQRTRLGRLFNYGAIVIEGNQGEFFMLENLGRVSICHEAIATAVRGVRGD